MMTAEPCFLNQHLNGIFDVRTLKNVIHPKRLRAKVNGNIEKEWFRFGYHAQALTNQFGQAWSKGFFKTR